MIKKIFSVLLFVGVFCITSCFGYTEISNCYNLYNDCNSPSSSNAVGMFCWELENGEEFTYNGNTYKIDNNLNFLTYTGLNYNKLLWTRNTKTGLYDKVQNYFYWGNDEKLHIVETQYNYGSSLTFDSGGVCILETNDINELAQKCGFWSATNSSERENCNPSSCNLHYYGDINEFYNTNGGFDKIYFLPGISMTNLRYDYGGRFCFIKGNTGYCLLTDLIENGSFNCNYGTVEYQKSNYSNSNYKLADNLTNYYESPFSGQSGGGEGGDYNFQDLSSDAIRYFENMGFRKSMCYVGTNDLTTNYGSGSDSFQSGTGKTIFDLFESIYIDIDETDLGLQAVSNWLNSWLGNYDKRFSTNGNPGYKLFYSSVDELIHVDYYGDGDTPVFPFLNNPYAIYFMATNISTYTQYKSMFYYEGDEVVDYCNLKINGGTFNQMISNSIKDSVINSSSNNIGGNNFLSGSWSGGSGSFIGGGGTGGTSGFDIIDYTGTWSDLQFSGDVDLKSFFDNALEEMKGAIDNMQNPLTGVLPNYLIFALLLVVLFKILRH